MSYFLQAVFKGFLEDSNTHMQLMIVSTSSHFLQNFTWVFVTLLKLLQHFKKDDIIKARGMVYIYKKKLDIIYPLQC